MLGVLGKLGACNALALAEQAPARLLLTDGEAQQEARKELREAVASMLGVSAVALADSTLTDSSQFSFARTPRYDASGQLLQGRVIEQPHIFKLVKRNKACWLIHQNSGKQLRLIHAKCIAE